MEVAYLEQAMVQGRQCDPQKPLALYADALNLDSSDVQLWLRFGRAAMTARAPAVARVAFERGLELHPHHPLLCEELLQVLIQVCTFHLECCGPPVDCGCAHGECSFVCGSLQFPAASCA